MTTNFNKDIMRFVRLSPLANCRYYHLLRFHLRKKNLQSALEQCRTDAGNEELIKSQMKEAWVRYRWDFDEFSMYHYADISDAQRAEFVSNYEKNIFCDEVNDYRKSKIFDSKWRSYCQFKSFFHRDCVFVRPGIMDESLSEFFRKHKKFIYKPDSAACGRGIKIVSISNAEEDAKQFVSSIRWGG